MTKRGNQWWKAAAIFIFCFCSLFWANPAEAAEQKTQELTAADFRLSAMELEGYTGETFSLSVETSVEESRFTVKWILDDKFIQVSDTDTGREMQFMGQAPGGNVLAKIYEVTEEGDLLRAVYGCQVSVAERTGAFDISSVTLLPGEKVALELSVDPADRITAVEYKSLNEKTAIIDADTKTITGVGKGTARIQAAVHFQDTADVLYVTCNVTVVQPALSAKTITCAVNAIQTASAVDYKDMDIQWTVADSGIAAVDAKTGRITGKKAGKTSIKAVFTSKRGAEYQIEGTLIITNPQFTQKTFVVAKGSKLKLTLTGIDGQSQTKSWKSAHSSKIAVANGTVTAKKAGTATVSAVVDGKQVSCTVTVSEPKLDTPTLIVQKGKTAKIKVSGTKAGSVIRYKAKNSKIVKVTSTGKIKGLTYGSTAILVTVDGKTLEVTAAVGKKTAVKAVKRAYKALGCTYSQPKRMSKNYYDCSSLVWRSYAPYGIRMGVKTTWAPTAAAQAYYFKVHNKVVAYKYVSESKMRVGDLIYFDADSSYNGRYRGIDHVAMYVGNGKIIHANATTWSVAETDYKDLKKYVTLIARPVK